MSVDITLETLRKRKCILCGDIHKSIANVKIGQEHIATVTVCCNCGLTLTFSHSASEYARYLESGDYEHHIEMCPEKLCIYNNKECPRIQKGRKI